MPVPVSVVLPARIDKKPPEPVLPLPTVKVTSPPLPPVAAPDPIEMEPESPLVDVPELNIRAPDIPVVPALAVRILNNPLLVAEP